MTKKNHKPEQGNPEVVRDLDDHLDDDLPTFQTSEDVASDDALETNDGRVTADDVTSDEADAISAGSNSASSDASTEDSVHLGQELEPEPEPVRRGDPYKASGRAAPRVIAPLAPKADYRDADADFASDEDSETEYIPRSGQVAGAYDGSPAEADTGVHPAARASEAGAELDRDGDRDLDRDVYDDSDEQRTALLTAAPLAGGAAAGGAAATGATAQTTAMPRNDLGVYDDRDFEDEPLATQPGQIAYEEDEYEEIEYRRGTLDLGLLLLRLGVGGLLLLQGLAAFFQLGGNEGVAALENQFVAQNFSFGAVLATAIPTIQVVAGALLIFGLATPLGASLALAVSAYMSMFEVAQSGLGWSILGDNAAAIQMQLLFTIAAVALQFTGPGRYGVDLTRGWATRPLASSWIFALLGVAGAVVAWYATAGTWPFVG